MRVQPPCAGPARENPQSHGLERGRMRLLRSQDFVRACGDNFARLHRMSGWVYRQPSPADGPASARTRRRIPQRLLRVHTNLPGSCLRADSRLSRFPKRTCLLSVRRIPDGRFSTRAAGRLAGGADLWLQCWRTQRDAASHLLASTAFEARRRRPAPQGLQAGGTASAASAPSAWQAATCSAESWPWSRVPAAGSDFESGNTLSWSWQLNRQRRISGPSSGNGPGSGTVDMYNLARHPF